MSAYWIGRAQTKDPLGYKRYSELIAPLAKVHPLEVLARAGRTRVIEGATHFDRYVLLRFPDMDAALAYYNTPEYQEAAAIRRAASVVCDLVITEGV
jgi:uncharacterized protein (DUF1330 family)